MHKGGSLFSSDISHFLYLSNFEFWSFWKITAEELTFCGSPQYLHLYSVNINIILFKRKTDQPPLKFMSFQRMESRKSGSNVLSEAHTHKSES